MSCLIVYAIGDGVYIPSLVTLVIDGCRVSVVVSSVTTVTTVITYIKSVCVCV